ncbi:gamma-glutamyltransferase [Purpureocillium lavendulum]|uniref:Gamma-glutamyltransferase n=1 Tax=Purpureocillium lavendulum TaxID=1247861 RepID=A0AB34FEP0_9HYPO|nr:gamma-glutamyltransferase [Purpureocillium lavendulum]
MVAKPAETSSEASREDETTPSPAQNPPAPVFKFESRRSVVHSTEGIVACSQPLAAKCGLDVLRAGGNAAHVYGAPFARQHGLTLMCLQDAAVAVAAGLNVTEPVDCGLGGDAFILYWDAAAKKVSALNGSGRSGMNYTLDRVRAELEPNAFKIPQYSPHSVTVPGAAGCWVDTVENLGSGKLTLAQVLEPATALAEKGFPVSEVTAYYWGFQEKEMREASPSFAELLKKDPAAQNGVRPPRNGEIFKNPTLAQTFKTLAAEGRKGFYEGRIAKEIIQVLRDRGGFHKLEDLKQHGDVGSESVEPISLAFCAQGLGDERGVRLWEHPPNGMGIVALMAMGIIQEAEAQDKIPVFTPKDFNTTPYVHVIIEALRLAFADANWFVTDPDVTPVPTAGLISKEYLAERAKLFDPKRVAPKLNHGDPPRGVPPAFQSCDTVYFSVTDAQGNAASFIGSNFSGFGTTIIPCGCGFTLQNRGSGFSLDPEHPNRIEPRKRPYHTIIPGLVTNLAGDTLHSTLGVMGGNMQPQGHVQVLMAQLVGGKDPQESLDAARFRVRPSQGSGEVTWTVEVESSLPPETIEGLRKLGHKIEVVGGNKRTTSFGRGQVIRRTTGAEATALSMALRVWSDRRRIWNGERGEAPRKAAGMGIDRMAAAGRAVCRSRFWTGWSAGVSR